MRARHPNRRPSASPIERPASRPFAIEAICVIAFLAVWILGSAGLVRADTQENVLPNGDLTRGSGNRPDKWRTAGWKSGPEFTIYRWNHLPGKASELKVSSTKANDAYWAQDIHLAPGWYHFTASVRAEGIPQESSGANISILEDGITSPHLRGTVDWQTTGFYLKVGDPGADVSLACRLGGFSSLNTGKAFCRDLRAIKIDAPPANADAAFTYDLDLIRHPAGAPRPAAQAPSTGGNPIPIAVELLIAAAVIGFVAWRRFSGGVPTAITTTLRKFTDAMRRLAPKPAPVTWERHPNWRIEVALFLVTFISFAYFYQASDHGTGARFDLMRSLAERRTIWVDGYCGYNTADIVSVSAKAGAHLYSVKAPGGAFTGVPAWLFFSNALSPIASRNEPIYWALTTYLTIVFSTGLLVAISCVVMHRFALFVGAPPGRAVALALILAFATIMFPYATEMTGEPIAAVCAFVSFYLLATDRLRVDAGRATAAGALAGWAVLCDFPALLIAGPLAIYALFKFGRRVIPFAVGAGAVALILFVHNKIAFGNPFFLSYQAYKLSVNSQFPEQAVGFVGLTYPRPNLLWKILIDPQRGLLFCNPILILVVPALIFFVARRQYRAEFAVAAIAIVGFILFNASFGESIVSWGGGTATGPRQIVATIPFIVFALAFLPSGWDYVLAPLALLSAFLMLMATAVEPHLPYEYQNPLRDFVWPAYLRGDLAYNKSTYFGGGPIVGDSVAFNLGKLAGLTGAVQLIPLAAFWIATAEYLLRALARESGRAPSILKSVAAAIAIGALFAPPIAGVPLARAALKAEHGLVGHYYEGLRPNGFPPHIVRVDKTINFPDIEELGALPYPSSVVWTGRIIAPSTGLYHFAINVDDAGWLKIDGRSVIDDPGEVSKYYDTGGMYLNAGAHAIEVGERNLVGGSSIRLSWQPPNGDEQVVPASVLLPH